MGVILRGFSVQLTMRVIPICYFLPLFTLTAASTAPSNDQCIMYDTCGWNPDCEDGVGCYGNQFLNCRYDGAPKPADNEALELLQSECPHLYDELTATGEVNLCCSTRQLRDLQSNFGMVSAFLAGTCPTCWYNFRKNFCDLTCSPKQASFVGANSYVEGPGFDGYDGQMVEMVRSVTYYANTAFVEAVYDSCKDVTHPSIGSVMNFFCGEWGAEHCTAFHLFDFQGSLNNGYTPFSIDYIYSSKTTTPDGNYVFHNPDILPCDKAAPHEEEGCVCDQCKSACYECLFVNVCDNHPNYELYENTLSGHDLH